MNKNGKSGKTPAQRKVRLPTAPPTLAHSGKDDNTRRRDKQVVREEMDALEDEVYEELAGSKVTYLCTTGTSISTRLKLELDHLAKRKLSEWDELQEEVGAIWNFVLERVNSYQPADYPNVGAEVNSLVRMGLRQGDQVVLLATGTVEGKLCAQLVEKFLRLKDLCDNVEVKVVEGLQAQNGDLFRRVGIKNLMAILCRYADDNVIINPTAGFKSVVPYLSLAGMIFRKPVKYIHEFSEDVITLVDLPITFDDELLFSVEEKLNRIEQQTTITIHEWNKGNDSLDHRLDTLIEMDGSSRNVTMSGLGLLLWERFKIDYPPGLVRTDVNPRNKPIRLDSLLSDNRAIQEKKNKLESVGVVHHGTKKLSRLADRLLVSPYVSEIVNSCEFQPESKRWIKPLSPSEAKKFTQIEQGDLCLVTLVNTDAGFSMLIRTTARDEGENFLISNVLTRKFFPC